MDERREKARQLREAGKTLKEIAEDINVSLSSASLYCKGVLPRGKHPQHPRKWHNMDKLREMYSAGVAIPQIATAIGVPAPTLYEWRHEMGLRRNNRSLYMTEEMRKHLSHKLTRDKTGELRLKAVRLYLDDELSTLDIAAELAVTATTVGQWLQQAGIELRKSPTVGTRKKLRQANLGSKRYNWKGGITRKQHRQRGSLYMRLAREACFERDYFTCRICGERGGQLNAHHIWPFQRFPERMYDVNNLLTLCKACRAAFHKAAGGQVKVAIGPFFAVTD
jgi:transposase-like protein